MLDSRLFGEVRLGWGVRWTRTWTHAAIRPTATVLARHRMKNWGFPQSNLLLIAIKRVFKKERPRRFRQQVSGLAVMRVPDPRTRVSPTSGADVSGKESPGRNASRWLSTHRRPRCALRYCTSPALSAHLGPCTV